MPRVLVVDDAEQTRSILAIALRTIPNADVLTAESAEEALELTGSRPVDVLVTDLRMAGMTGLELLAALRERSRWPAAGAIVVSGELDPDLPRRASAAGASAFFAKPFSTVELRRCVVSLLESSHGFR